MKILLPIFKWLNFVFKKYYILYKPLYYLYKNISDYKKIRFLKNKVRPGDVVLDIGANIGFYTDFFSDLTGETGTVHAFEPDELNFMHLTNNLKGKKNVVLNRKACGETSGNIALYFSEELNVDHQTYYSGEDRKSYDVPCIAMDDYLKQNEQIDFIKIDIQGYDYYAIKGMANLIKRSEHIIIMGEFWPYGLTKAGAGPAEYLSLLKDLGFTIKLIDGRGKSNFKEESTDKYFYTDFIGIKE